MVGDVLDALAAVAGLDGVIAVTAEPRAADAARDAGARHRARPPRGRPVGGRRARRRRGAGAGRASACCSCRATARRSIPPRSASLLARDRAVVIVPGPPRRGHQRAAALAAATRSSRPSGPGSFARHAARARAAGVAVRVAALPSLGLDVDTPGRPRGAARRPRPTRPGGAPRARARCSSRCSATRRRVIALEALRGPPRGPARRRPRRAARGRPASCAPTDVLAVAHKVVSKAEGRVVRLADVEPGERARELAAEHGKDPRQVEVILSETAELVRADAGRLICRTRHGFVCANAGVDALQRRRAGHARAAARSTRTPRRGRCARGSAARS